MMTYECRRCHAHAAKPRIGGFCDWCRTHPEITEAEKAQMMADLRTETARWGSN